jgi:CubicO group peptidase (beta-lactamase class C family)
VIGCGGPRGVVRPSNGGTAALGQLVADVTAAPFPVAATELVLAPLRMTSASYPTSVADLGPHAAVPYDVTPEGTFAPAPAAVCTLPAAGGLWATAADLVRLGTGWSSLLPPPLAREALPTDNGAPRGGGATGVGLGWFLSPRGDLAMAGGALPGSTASLLVRVRDGRVHLAVTTRNVALDRIGDRVLRAWAER